MIHLTSEPCPACVTHDRAYCDEHRCPFCAEGEQEHAWNESEAVRKAQRRAFLREEGRAAASAVVKNDRTGY